MTSGEAFTPPRWVAGLERLLFSRPRWALLVFALLTAVLAVQLPKMELSASFEKTIPIEHPYVVNYLEHQSDLAGLTNAIRIVVATDGNSILDPEYLKQLASINDEVYLLPGVDRAFMKSLWTPATRWLAVTEQGLDGGPVIPHGYDGSEASLEQVQANIQRSGEIGKLVAPDFQSSLIYVPLLDRDPETGEPLDYAALSEKLEKIRDRYEAEGLSVHIVGFGKLMGELIAGVKQVLVFFAVAIALVAVLLFAYTRCWRGTAFVLGCSLLGVVWQTGILAAAGYPLNPYSVLVPFLVLAIGISHGAQQMNSMLRETAGGLEQSQAARVSFRRLFVTGLTALLSDAVGFAVLMLIPVPVIQDLAVLASIGVVVLIGTNLLLLPLLFSIFGVSPAAMTKRSGRRSNANGALSEKLWGALARLARPGGAYTVVAAGVLLAVAAAVLGARIEVGDLDRGAPELREDSRFNRDMAYLVDHYAASSDVMVVMVSTPPDTCTRYRVLSKVDTLAWNLEQLPVVNGVESMAGLARLASVGYNEGSLKWYELVPNNAALGGVQTRAPRTLLNHGCSLLSMYVYLKDHRAETLEMVAGEVEAFAKQHNTEDVRFKLAAGNAGIQLATNRVISASKNQMLVWVYGAVILLCWITFRSWRGVVAAVLPLMLTSLMCHALMVLLGIGVKVATLPVIALGVGIGVDYSLYMLSAMLERLRAGSTLTEAYRNACALTGRVVLLMGVTLSISVATWAFSPIKFQADMGVLLAFMFFWNMLGALVLLPALAYFLFPEAREARTGDSPSASFAARPTREMSS